MRNHPTPLHRAPQRVRPPFDVAGHAKSSQEDRLAALLEALDGIELGAHDRRFLDWIAARETATVGTIASLIHRTRAAGVGDGAR